MFQKHNHDERPACGRVALGPPKLRAAAQGIHYASLTCRMFMHTVVPKPNHNECPACGRVALGPPKLLAAAQGIHYAAKIRFLENHMHEHLTS